MKSPLRLVALVLTSLGLASAAHAQTTISTGKNGSVIQTPGATISTNGAGSTIQTPGATIQTPGTGRPPRTAPRGAVRKPKDTSPAGTRDITIDGNNDHRTIDCQGNTVTVNGNSNRLLLRGTCTKLVINGNENTVRWSGSAPAVSDLGNKNVTGQVN